MRLLHGVDLETIDIAKMDGINMQLPPLDQDPLEPFGLPDILEHVIVYLK